MYFGTKSYWKSNHYHTPKHPLSFRDFKRTNYCSVGLDVDLLIWVRGVWFVDF
jgi:hypothetical protein